jgi:hypothetical protein
MMVNQTAKFFEKFTVKMELMGLAIGTHGSNILKAREVPGISAVEVEDDTCTIKVFGEVSDLLFCLIYIYIQIIFRLKKLLKKHVISLNIPKILYQYREN